jgi:predicted transcriptional regulator
MSLALLIDKEELPKVRRSKTARMNPIAFALMIKAIQDKGCTIPELVEITGLHTWTLRHYLKELVNQGVAHIEGWTKDRLGRDTTPHYRLGYGFNVPRGHKTGAQKKRDSRQRARAMVKSVNEILRNSV